MSFFVPTPHPQLFIAPSSRSDPGFVGLLLAEGVTVADPAPGRGRGNRRTDEGGGGVSLADALTDKRLDASFLFSAHAPELADAKQAAAFVQMIRTKIMSTVSAKRAFVWLGDVDPRSFERARAWVLGLANPGSQTVNPEVVLPFCADFGVQLRQGFKVDLDGTALRFSSSAPDKLTLVGARAPEVTVVRAASLAFTGPQRGCLSFELFATRQSVAERLAWGMQIAVPGAPASSAWLPLATREAPAGSGAGRIGFVVCLDPTDPENAVVPGRSFLGFTGVDEGGAEVRLSSHYRCRSGSTLALIPVGAAAQTEELRPARLVLNLGVTPAGAGALPDFHFAPDGDYGMTLTGPSSASPPDQLLCGLSGSETVSFWPRDAAAGRTGDRLRFVSRKPAYVSRWPFETASPLAAPVDPGAELLDATLLSSWATVRRDPDQAPPHYVSQPAGTNLFGRDTMIHADPQGQALLGFTALGYALPQDDLCVPIYPYAGFAVAASPRNLDAATLEALERRVLAPTRRAQIAARNPPPAADGSLAPRAARLGADAPDAGTAGPSVTTPAGLLARLRAPDDYRWASLLLGQNTKKLELVDLDAPLQAAFLTSDLFLVVANSEQLAGAPPSTTAFHNEIDIEDWSFRAAVGHNRAWGDYRNVMIVKGRRGKLADLIVNPALWTERQTFAAPSLPQPDGSLGAPDPGQLVMLSRWLQEYVSRARAQTNAFFDRFKAMLDDENWTGILFLRVDIAEIPKDLAGIVAGLDDDALFLHHLGVEISLVAGTALEVEQPSSMFGLINYVDPRFDVAKPEAAIATNDPGPYGFRVLTLQVLFENTAVRDFYSVAQLNLGRLFGASPAHMGEGGNPYDAVILRGSYQNQGGKPSYRLASVGTSDFFMPGQPLNKVEITGAAMTTRDPGTTLAHGSKRTVSWYGMDGFLDFAVPADTHDPPRPVDLWSFGAPPESPTLRRQGLRFAGLGLRQTLITAADGSKEVSFEFIADELHFDLATSTPRFGGLFSSFGLELRGLVQGSAEAAPRGYLPVISDVAVSGVSGQPWWGLRFRLDLGTPGALAGKVGLSSELLLAWAPLEHGQGGSASPIFVGLSLPGTNGDAKLMSLQSVLRLSIGDLVLNVDHERKAFVLLLTEIGLKVFGLLDIPPGGSTSFYLFGDPGAGGQPSGLAWYAVYAKAIEKAGA